MFASPGNSSYSKPGELNGTQVSSLGTPLDQSTPAFLFSKRKSNMPANFSNGSMSTASAPCNDIFSYPQQTNIPQHVKDSSFHGSKTVHWSPSLVQTSDKSNISLTQATASNISFNNSISTPNKSSAFTGQVLNAPPLRSLRDKIEPAKKVARRNTFAARSNTTTTPILTNQRVSELASGEETSKTSTEEASENWVTVFGFQPNQLSKVLDLFSRHGEVVSHQAPSKGNFVHIRYSCVTHAHQALSRNSTMLDSDTYIAVMPCNNKDVLNGSATGIVSRSASNKSMSMYHSIMEDGEVTNADSENVNNCSILNSSHFDGNQSLNTSRMSFRSGAGMRPLAADQRINAAPQSRQDGLLNKLWNTIGLN